MLLVQVEGPDALLKGEEGLVDLRAVELGLFVRLDCVSASFRTSQVNEGHLRKHLLVRALLQEDLEDGMGARGVGVGACRARSSALEADLNLVHDVFYAFGGLLS